MTDYSQELRDIGNRLLGIADELEPIPEPTPEPEPEPTPTPGEFSLVVPANKLELIGGVSMVLDGNHIAIWGHPGETAKLKVKTPKAMNIEIALDYALARASQATPSQRIVRVLGSNKTLILSPTEDSWEEERRAWTSRAQFAFPAGETAIEIENGATQPWTNWGDLYAVGLTSSEGAFEVLGFNVPQPGPAPEPTPTPGPIPIPDGSVDAVIGRDGTLMEIVNRLGLRPMLLVVPPGVWDMGGYIYFGANQIYPDEGLRVLMEPGSVLQGWDGIEPYGCRNIHFFSTDLDNKGKIRVIGYGQGDMYGNGLYGDSDRQDKGAAPGSITGQITMVGLDVGPVVGTGILSRAGLSIWGGDAVVITDCDIHDAAGTAEGFGGAASGISIGHSRRLPGAIQGPRVLLARNKIWNMIASDGNEDSADRNGIILDLYHGPVGGPGTGLYNDRVLGDVVIEDNEIWDVYGRGIQILVGGTDQSQIVIQRNHVHGFYADHLGGSNPMAGIGGYGDGKTGNILLVDNDVEPHGDRATYRFESFSSYGGVRGSGNKCHGGRVEWINSPGNAPPSEMFID